MPNKIWQTIKKEILPSKADIIIIVMLFTVVIAFVIFLGGNR